MLNRELFITSKYKTKNRRLRYLFTFLGISMIVILVIFPIIKQNELFRPITMPKINTNLPNQFKMNNTEFKGLDNNNKPFLLIAKTAYQAHNNNSEINIEKISGFFYKENDKNDITADKGIYSLLKNEIKLVGHVNLKSSTGDSIQTNELVIKTKHNSNFNTYNLK